MANGKEISVGSDQVSFKLLDAQVQSSSGTWVEAPRGLNNKAFDATSLEEGADDAVVEVMVSGADIKPRDSEDGHLMADLTTVVPAATDSAPWRYVKAKKIAGTTPIATTVVVTFAK